MKVVVSIIVAALFVGCASDKKSSRLSETEQSASDGSNWGYYSGEPVTRWNPDGRTMTLMSELRYTDPQGVVWIAAIGSRWRIHPPLPLVDHGRAFEGKYRNASVLHDVAYGQHNRPWQDCDRMFYYAMRCSGVSPVESKTMYYALYKFGHHWKFPIKRAKPVKYEGGLVARAEEIPRAVPVNPDQINEARDWIRSAEPSLEEIEQRANAEGR